MIEGIVWAVFAGIILGLFALPEKFTRDFKYENTWGMFFLINMIFIPVIAGFILVNGYGEVLKSLPSDVLIKMFVSSFLWGIGMMMWGKAINHIGLSLGFSLFIGTIILVGSLLPFLVDGLPPANAFATIMIGIAVVLIGVIANGRAGLMRSREENKAELQDEGKSSMAMGISIAVIGGLLATGFSFANAVGRPLIHEACQAAGNPEWATAVGVMIIIYLTGGLVTTTYIIWQVSKKKMWGTFKTPYLGKNTLMATLMAIFNFSASVTFAIAAFKLGSTGNTVGYAIFNTISVAVAIISGLITREWVNASSKARYNLYFGLAAMIIGVVIIAYGNSMVG
ncbi:L-rhamnose-proton symporter [subsurface metagenome]